MNLDQTKSFLIWSEMLQPNDPPGTLLSKFGKNFHLPTLCELSWFNDAWYTTWSVKAKLTWILKLLYLDYNFLYQKTLWGRRRISCIMYYDAEHKIAKYHNKVITSLAAGRLFYAENVVRLKQSFFSWLFSVSHHFYIFMLFVIVLCSPTAEHQFG